jgi:predicted MFS family arabinose efflux permease
VVAVVLFLTTCAFFAAIVFLPLFLQRVTGASAVESGLLLLPMLLAGTISTAVIGRVVTRTGHYKAFPAVGLGLMSVGLLLLSRLDASASHATVAAYTVVFGLGFGMVSQLLVLAIQNAVDQRDIGIATASANLFRALGGSVGAAVFGAIFASRVSSGAGAGAIADGLDTVFLAAAPVAALGLLAVLFLKERPLRGPSPKAAAA